MFKQIIEEICNELGIKFTPFSKDWCFLLEKDGKQRVINGYKFGLNSQSNSLIADDKYALYELMQLNNVPIIEHKILFNEHNDEEYATESKGFPCALEYFKSHNNNIVVKPNDGTCGINVFHVRTEDELKRSLEKLKNKFSISLCPYYDIENEYRIIFLNSEIKIMYGKSKPVIYGNGKNTVKELLQMFNSNYFNEEEAFFNKDIDNDYIPKNGEVIEYGWQFNLARGSKVFEDIDENIKNKIVTLAKKAYDASGLKFCSVDVIETKNHEELIMEINSGVLIGRYIDLTPNGYNNAKETYKAAIIEMFK